MNDARSWMTTEVLAGHDAALILLASKYSKRLAIPPFIAYLFFKINK